MTNNRYKSSAARIPVSEAVGTVLAHDITEIRPGQFKGPAFRKGQIIREEDIEHLQRLGKNHLYVLKIAPGELHEDEAALRLATALCGPGVVFTPSPAEGKIALTAEFSGLLKVDVPALTAFNTVPEVSCASRHNNTLVAEGETVAATRAIPLIISESTVERAADLAREAGGVFTVKRLARLETGLVITGNEVYSGRIEDKFAPILRKKIAELGGSIRELRFLPDDREKIASGIKEFLASGVQLVLVAGGMSVDPDDVSRLAIADAGATDVVYGTPVLPGAMFLYGRLGEVPVLGIPACVLYFRATVLDLILPRVVAGESITREDLAAMAHGGLCLNCDQCRFPVCPFGK